MKTIISILISLLSISLQSYPQQVITLCEGSNNKFTYNAFCNQMGHYSWLIDDLPINDEDSSITIDWSDKSLGIHFIDVEFSNIYGCTSPVITYNVELVDCPITTIYIPNAFTPNGDDMNNIWLPVSYDTKKVEFTIYDRWGIKIFESSDSFFGWDGTFDGKPCPNDVYVYSIKWISFDDRINTKFGQISLIR